MADAPISEELTVLKKRARRRLVGAVALVLLALLVLWSVMDDKPPQSLVAQPVAIVSSSPALVSTVNPSPAAVPLAAGPAATPALPAVPATVEPASPTAIKPLPATATKPAQPESKPEPAPPAKPEAKVEEKKPEPKPAKPKQDPAKILAGLDEAPAKPADKEKPLTVATAGKFYLQLGAFADKDKAQHLVAKARESGVVVMTEAVKTDKGNLTRLRAGPFASHEQADKAHAKLAGAGIASSVVGK